MSRYLMCVKIDRMTRSFSISKFEGGKLCAHDRMAITLIRPIINIIEHIWYKLKKSLHLKEEVVDKQHLWRKNQKAWTGISQATCE